MQNALEGETQESLPSDRRSDSPKSAPQNIGAGRSNRSTPPPEGIGYAERGEAERRNPKSSGESPVRFARAGPAICPERLQNIAPASPSPSVGELWRRHERKAAE